jgi:hypothetical protein
MPYKITLKEPVSTGFNQWENSLVYDIATFDGAPQGCIECYDKGTKPSNYFPLSNVSGIVFLEEKESAPTYEEKVSTANPATEA